MKVRLESVANWIIILTGVTLTVLMVFRFVSDQRELSRPSPQGYRVGETVTAGEFPVDFSQTPQTLVFILSSQCHFCGESVPFYRDLLKTRAGSSLQTRMVVVGLEDTQILRQYTKEYDLVFDDVTSVTRDKIRFKVTPTLVLLDRSGTIRGLWTGLLSSDQRRQEVTSFVKTGHA